MSKAVTTKMFQAVANWSRKNAPAIITGFSITGVISTGVLAARGAQQALYAVAEQEIEKDDALTLKEQVKIVYPYYIPAAITGLMTITCIVSLNRVHNKRTAALASLYSLTETTLREYKDQILKEVGPKKAQKIADDIAQKKLDEHPISRHEVFETGNGDTLCFDVLTGRYFRSDIEAIKRAQNDFNFKLINEAMYWMSVNELYYELGLKPVKLGDHVGWNTEKLLDMKFSSKLTEHGDPCLVIDYQVEPRFLNY